MKLRAHWAGELPKVGDYFMSTMRPKYAYRIVAIGSHAAIADCDRIRLHLDRESYWLEVEAERVSPYDVPDDAVVHAWKWDARDKKARAHV